MNLLVGNNNETLESYGIHQKGKVIDIAPDDTYALVTLSDGAQFKIEFYYGSGYLSQGSRNIVLPLDFRKVTIFKGKFQSRVIRNYPKTL